MAGLALGALDGCIISSVVPQSIFNLRNLARRYLHVEPLVIGENVDLGIPKSGSTSRRRPGPTGWSTRWALTSSIPAPLIVIDSGTATTFDVIAADGGFEGGVIAPGINLSMEALHNGGGKVATGCHPEAAAGCRQGHGRRHAGGRLLGLCRPDRGPDRADQGRAGRKS